MNWIDCTTEMPPKDLLVEVRGRYTPDGHAFPKAYLRDPFRRGKLIWNSSEWRGTVAIRQWRYIDEKSEICQ